MRSTPKNPSEDARPDHDGPLKAHSAALLPILLALIGLQYDIESVKRLETQFKPYQERRADIVFELLLKDGKKIVVHIELQSTNHPAMLLRMGQYYVAICESAKEPPLQIVFYTGEDECKMVNTASGVSE